MARVLFLFNHDQFHQVAHSLPIALQLRAAGRHDVVMSYRPRSVTLGLCLSILGVVSTCCWGLWSLRCAR